jgi:hypothetical protein
MSSKSAKNIEGCQHVGYCYFVKEIWRDTITLLSKLRWLYHIHNATNVNQTVRKSTKKYGRDTHKSISPS